MDKYDIFANYFDVTTDNIEIINKNYDILKTIIETDDDIEIPDDIKKLVFNIYKSKGTGDDISSDFDRAITYFKRALEIVNSENNDDCCDIYNAIGCCYEQNKDYENMLKYYGLYIKCYNFGSLYSDILEDNLYAMGKHAQDYNFDMIEYYIIGANNGDWNSCEHLIDYYKNLGNHDMAIKYSIKLNSSFSSPFAVTSTELSL